MRRASVGVCVVVGALALLGLTSTSALGWLPWPPADPSAEFGDRCTADALEAGTTAIVAGNGLPALEFPKDVPGEGGLVITRWKVALPAGSQPIQQQLVVFGYRGGPEGPLEFVPIGESAVETAAGGAANEFTTRIPVSSGKSIGLRGPAGALVCAAETKHSAALVADPWPGGEPRPGKWVEMGVPVIATVERDGDGDGYGDPSQDQCLEEPRLHTACPSVHLLLNSKVYKRGILIEASTGDPARLEVAGHVGWTYRPPGGGPKKQLAFDLPGGTQDVAQGATVSFWLQLPRQAVERLRTLTRKNGLKVHVGFVATDVLGHQSMNELTYRVPGWRVIRPAARHSR